MERQRRDEGDHRALNVAYGETEKRSFIRLNLASLFYTLVAMASLMVAIGAVVVAPIVLQMLGLGGVAGALIAYARWPALLVLVIVMLAAACRYLPCRREPRWEWLTPGSSVAAVGWFVSSLLFSWYIANFGNYNVTYGSLGAAVGLATRLRRGAGSRGPSCSRQPEVLLDQRGHRRSEHKGCCGGRMIIVETFQGARPERSPLPTRIRIDSS